MRRGGASRSRADRRRPADTMRPHDDRAGSNSRAYSPGLKGVVAGETSHLPCRRRSRVAFCTAATRSASWSSTARTRRWPSCCGLASGRMSTHRSRARPLPDPVLAATLRQLPAGSERDGCAAHRPCLPGARSSARAWPPTVEQARALTTAAPSVAGGVRPAAGGPGADRAGPVARPRRRVPVPAHRRAARPAAAGRSRPISSSPRSTASTRRPSPRG